MSTSAAEARKQLIKAVVDHWKPSPKLSPAEWAEQNIKIPIGNAIPGMIRFDNAPYQREPLDLIADPDVEHITLMWGAQTGKTQLINCAIGYNISQEPVSQMMMQPSQGDLQTWLETKLSPLINDNEILTERVAKPRGRDGVNNQRMKSYPGGFLMFAWSGSPKTMRGRSAPKIFCDEVDGYEVTAEGHPVSLLWQRAATFGDQRLLIETSTPTIKDFSQVEKSFEAGDKRRFYVTCPHCEFDQSLTWSNVSWSKDDQGNHLPDTAVYVCDSCGVGLTDGERLAAIRAGYWKAEKPFQGHASYHLSELYSTFRKLRDVVKSFLEKKAQGDLQTFVNVSLGETWDEGGEQLDWENLYNRREHYRADIPDGVLVLTAAVDVQDDRLEVGIEGHGLSEENWKIDYIVLRGDPSRKEIWNKLDDVVTRKYKHESGVEMAPACVVVDSGFLSDEVYRYVRQRQNRRVFAVKGKSVNGAPLVGRPSKPSVKKGLLLYPLGTDTAKDSLFARLRVNQPGASYCHFPVKDCFDVEYFQQLTGEKVVSTYVMGRPKRVWKKTRARQEALDISVYNMAALVILNPNLHKLKTLLTPENVDENVEDEPEKEEDTVAPTRQRSRPRQRQRGGFVNSWR